jgi:hypothetical protein
VARVSLAAVLVLSGIAIVMRPWSVAARLGATGSVWGFLAVAAVEYALFLGASPQARPNLPVTLWALCAAALSACALAPYDKSNWLCFHALAVGCAATGWLALSMCNLRRRQLLGSGWQQTFNVAAARESDRRDSVGHDLSCATCGYNLRGLAAPGRCPECDTPIARSMEHVLSRLTPQWSGQFAEVRSRATRSVLLCAGLSAVLAFRAIAGDPQRPWWSAMLLCGSAALCMTLAAWGPRRSLAYLGGLGACLAASVWFTVLHWSARLGGAENLTNLFAVNLAALALAGGAWLRIERTWLRERSLEPKPGRLPAFHRLAALLATAGAVVLAAAATLAAGRGDPLDGVGAACAVALGLTAALIFAFRDHPQFQCTCLYALGLAAVVWIIAQAGLAPRTLAGALSLGLAGYALITSAALRVWARRGEPAGDSVPGSEALRRSNSVLSVAALALAGLVILIHPGMTMRMLVCAAPLLGAGAALAGVSGAAHMRTTCLALCAAAGALAGCSWVSPGAAAAWLHRAAGVVVAGCVLITAAGLAVRCIRRVEVWREALRISVAGTAAVTGAALLFCVWVEVDALFAGRIPPLAGAAVAAVIAALAVVIVCCAVFAADERWDPLRFSARGREGYVYAGEALAVLLGLHIRATMPWLFHGFITSYWPILILGLACAALAVGQTCTRRGLAVIGRPLERTGVALPLVALLEVFIAASRVHYSLVLLTAGALYAVLAAMRRSLPLGGLAALTLNGSLWYLLHHTPGLGLTRHPQLWFVPLALAVLAAGHLNRRRLAAGQYLALNYACLMTIYLSSTADIFLVGVARAPWLPLVLAALSIAGILAGIASRLRSFLMLGTGFLCLALLTMIWHAASNLGWTWAWYVSGIALGILIITLFALLEKKRGELIAWLEQFSH